MAGKAHVNLTLDQTLLNWIDSLRGQEPRSAFINKILSKFSFQTKKAFDWDVEEQKAQEDIKKGRVYRFKTTQEALRWLKS